jgi:hypothetical protein
LKRDNRSALTHQQFNALTSVSVETSCHSPLATYRSSLGAAAS